MNLDELVTKRHNEIKELEFSKLLRSGKIDKDLYATYLFNLHPMYDVIEAFGRVFGLLDGAVVDYRRGLRINEDFREIWGNRGDKPAELAVTEKYLRHVKNLADSNPNMLSAHLYVRLVELTLDNDELKNGAPGNRLMLEFKSTDNLIQQLTPDNDLIDEVNICFDFIKEMFEEMMSLTPVHVSGSGSATDVNNSTIT